jgi:predicted DNA-binding protein with PD1-like motif
MEYQEKTVQRIFSVRFSSGERIIESLEKLIQEKNIRAGAILFAGAFSDGNLVSGFRFIGRIEEAGAAGAEAFVLEFSGNSSTS